MKPVFLSAEWRNLAMANYVIEPELLAPYLPYATELDLFNGACYISLIGFMFTHTKLKGVPVPFHRTFEEVNLRFYVRHKTNGEWRRGVVFIREFVPRYALAVVARTMYQEPYTCVPMGHKITIENDLLNVSYHWDLDRRHTMELIASATPEEIAIGSEAEFITEHYWGYTKSTEKRTSEYGVEHPRWRTHAVKGSKINVDFGTLYGEKFGFLDTAVPRSVLLAEGSAIIVRGKRMIG